MVTKVMICDFRTAGVPSRNKGDRIVMARRPDSRCPLGRYCRSASRLLPADEPCASVITPEDELAVVAMEIDDAQGSTEEEEDRGRGMAARRLEKFSTHPAAF